MKREGYVMERVGSWTNIKKATHRSQVGKKGKYGVIKFNKNRRKNMMELRDMLHNLTYHTSEYQRFTIVADQGKIREIFKLPYYPDRIAHHAIVNVIEKKRVRSFIRDTFCCIKGRGLMDGTNRLQKALRHNPEETKYCLKIDIKKFFPSVHPEIMSREFRRLYKDKRFLTIMDDIIYSVDKGLPIGSLTSQLMSNVYMSPLDHYIKDKLGVKFYFRYCDDIVVLSSQKGYLKWVLREIKKFVSERLGLEVKNTVQIFEVEKIGIDFLGYKFFHEHRVLRKSIKKNFCRAMKKVKSEQRLQDILASYKGWCEHGNCRRLWRLQTGLHTYVLPSQAPKEPKKKPKKAQNKGESMRTIRNRRWFYKRLDECEQIMVDNYNEAKRKYYTDAV